MLDEQYKTGNKKTDALIEKALAKGGKSNQLFIPEVKKGRYTVAQVSDRTSRDNITFDSKQEKERYEELLLLQKAGKIFDLEIQKRFVLLDDFEYRMKVIRGFSYYADFYYRELSFGFDYAEYIKVVEEWKVKATVTKDYILKKKLFLSQHQEIDFREMVSDL